MDIKEVEKALYKEKIQDILNKEDSFSRFHALFSCFFDPKINSEMFAELLGEYYGVCDNTFAYRNEIRIAFNRAKKHKDKLMTKEAYDFYRSIPEKVTIYRGMTAKESRKKTTPFGVSWTLEKKVAEFFAHDYIRNYATENEPKTVLEAIVDKSEIVAIFLDRKEYEVICLNVTRKNIVKSKA